MGTMSSLAQSSVSVKNAGTGSSAQNVPGTSAPALPANKVLWDAANSVSPDPHVPIKVLPEPSTLALCAVGATGLLLARRRKK